MNSHDQQLPPHHQTVADRFVAACQADERVLAALLIGSYARGTADAYSDLDLCVTTTDVAYDDFVAGREAFVRRLGEPLFLEDFDLPNTVFYIFANGAEGELYFGRESQIDTILNGPYRVLLDKTGVLTETVFSGQAPVRTEPMETLRRQVCWFWHDLSHFITALGRGQLWWASGQLEALRGYCVNLVRLRQDISDPDAGDEAYFKLEKAVSVETLSALQATFCPPERNALLQAALIILHFYQAIAPAVAQTHGVAYPTDLEQLMVDRLKTLRRTLVP